jgi:hypothetical protein
MLSRIRERRRITRADIEALVDAVIEQQPPAFVAMPASRTHSSRGRNCFNTNRTMLRSGDTTRLRHGDARWSIDGDATAGYPCNEKVFIFNFQKLWWGRKYV